MDWTKPLKTKTGHAVIVERIDDQKVYGYVYGIPAFWDKETGKCKDVPDFDIKEEG